MWQYMKTHGYVFLIVFFIMTFCSTSPLAYGETTVSTGVRYDTFTNDLSPEGTGTELTIPFGAIYKRDRLLLRLEAAYSRATVNSGADADANISSFSDTLLAGSYTFPDWPVGIIVGVNVNIPTGKEQLRRTEQAVEAGERHDLFEVDDFGEGLNIGLNLGLVKEFGSLNVGLNGAYIFKGQYDPTKDVSNDDFAPGDQALIFAALKWKANSWVEVGSIMTYSHFFPEKTNGQETYQEGGKMALGGHVRVQRQPIEIVVGLQNMVQGKSKEIMGDTLKNESENSNGSELFGWIDMIYRVSPKLDLQMLGDIRNYGESDRKNEVTGLRFNGHRFRYAIGPGVTYVVNDHFTWNAVAKYFVMEQERDVLLNQDVTFRGVNISVGVRYTF